MHACDRERENAKNRNICKIARKRWERRGESANDLVRRRREREKWKTSVHSRWRERGRKIVGVCVVNTDRMCAEE